MSILKLKEISFKMKDITLLKAESKSGTLVDIIAGCTLNITAIMLASATLLYTYSNFSDYISQDMPWLEYYSKMGAGFTLSLISFVYSSKFFDRRVQENTLD